MEGKNINLLLGKLCSSIGEGFNKNTGESFICNTNIVRIAAFSNTFIKSSVFNEDSTGIYFPEGAIEYFKVNIGDIITVLSGSVNISSIK